MINAKINAWYRAPFIVQTVEVGYLQYSHNSRTKFSIGSYWDCYVYFIMSHWAYKGRDDSWGNRLGGGNDNLTNFIDLVTDWPTKKGP